jgi:pimeloyl-ACP methyl ester carboxylesterase
MAGRQAMSRLARRTHLPVTYRSAVGATRPPGSRPECAKSGHLEKKLAVGPVITVPTITMEGDANGAPHPQPAAYRSKFSGKYEHRLITGGVGHNLPQEAPQAFAQAIVDVAEV